MLPLAWQSFGVGLRNVPPPTTLLPLDHVRIRTTEWPFKRSRTVMPLADAPVVLCLKQSSRSYFFDVQLTDIALSRMLVSDRTAQVPFEEAGPGLFRREIPRCWDLALFIIPGCPAGGLFGARFAFVRQPIQTATIEDRSLHMAVTHVDAQRTDSQSVYSVLAHHQRSEDWDLKALFTELQRWAEIFNLEFNLEIRDISLCVDWLSRRRFGHFRYGHNGFGLEGEIAINRRYLDRKEFWQVLGTLLHEMLHAWQQAHGKPGKWSYHNVQFRKKALEYGLVVDQRGVTDYEPKSPFMDLLRKHGVHVPHIPNPLQRRRGSSKLKKWCCGCTNVRVAVADFRAKCLRCGNVFVRAD